MVRSSRPLRLRLLLQVVVVVVMTFSVAPVRICSAWGPVGHELMLWRANFSAPELLEAAIVPDGVKQFGWHSFEMGWLLFALAEGNATLQLQAEGFVRHIAADASGHHSPGGWLPGGYDHEREFVVDAVLAQLQKKSSRKFSPQKPPPAIFAPPLVRAGEKLGHPTPQPSVTEVENGVSKIATTLGEEYLLASNVPFAERALLELDPFKTNSTTEAAAVASLEKALVCAVSAGDFMVGQLRKSVSVNEAQASFTKMLTQWYENDSLKCH